MLKVEELFERAKRYKKHYEKDNFWQALWLVFSEILYYGGAIILFNEKIYEVRNKDDAIMLFLEIYDTYKEKILDN